MRMNQSAGTWLVAVIGLTLLFSGCVEDREALAENERLSERIDELESEIETLDGKLETEREDRKDLLKQADDAEDRANEAEDNLEDVARELARFRVAEEKAQAVAAAEPSTKEKLESAKQKAEESLAALVTVKGDGGEGRGFVVEADGKTWLYTAASALAGNSQMKITTADDQKLAKFGVFEVASGADLARLEIQDEVAAKLTIGELVGKGRLIGVAEGGTALAEGRSYDAEAEVMRVDTRIGGCDPGGPVFDGESGALIGILIQVRDEERRLWPRESYQGREQRVVGRLDGKTEWVATDIGGFLKESKLIAETDRVTRLVTAMSSITPGVGGASLTAGVGGGWTMKQVFEENPDMRVISELKAIDEWLESRKMKPAERDVNKRYTSVFGQVVGASRRQMQGFEVSKFSPYHRKAAQQSLEWRKEADEKLSKVMEGMGG